MEQSVALLIPCLECLLFMFLREDFYIFYFCISNQSNKLQLMLVCFLYRRNAYLSSIAEGLHTDGVWLPFHRLEVTSLLLEMLIVLLLESSLSERFCLHEVVSRVHQKLSRLS